MARLAAAAAVLLCALMQHASAAGSGDGGGGRALAARGGAFDGSEIDAARAASSAGHALEDSGEANGGDERAALVLGPVLRKAVGRAARGGAAGLLAGALQVLAFMWLRTAMNVQYARGGDLRTALRALWREGVAGQHGMHAAIAGVARLYRGIGWAIVQAPLSRFGDTAANELALSLAAAPGSAGGLQLPLAFATALGSICGAAWRVALMPVDAAKTLSQVHGSGAAAVLRARVTVEGIRTLWAGALATLGASAAGHYPWFVTFNVMHQALPEVHADARLLKLVRDAACGVAAACASDCVSNSLRVLKTIRQTTAPGRGLARAPTYFATVSALLSHQGGWSELLGRGLRTRLLCNCAQSLLFAVIWRWARDAHPA